METHYSYARHHRVGIVSGIWLTPNTQTQYVLYFLTHYNMLNTFRQKEAGFQQPADPHPSPMPSRSEGENSFQFEMIILQMTMCLNIAYDLLVPT